MSISIVLFLKQGLHTGTMMSTTVAFISGWEVLKPFNIFIEI